MSKKVFMLIGAGFSYSLADQDLTQNFSHKLIKRINTVLENEQNICPKLKKIVTNFIQHKQYNFEHLTDILRHLGTLNDYGVKDIVDKESVERLNDLIHTELFINYGDSKNKIIDDRRKDFSKLITYLTSNNFEVHIFDLNFDSVLEDCLTQSDISHYDFFDGLQSWNTWETEQILSYRGPFNIKESLESTCMSKRVKIYKLHGAFNIISVNDTDHYRRTGIHLIKDRDQQYGGLQFGFYKIVDLYSVNEIFQKSFMKSTQDVSFIYGYKSDMSLWTGNLFKLAMRSLDQTYPSFCYESFKKIIESAQMKFIIGYGSSDLDIKQVLYNNLDWGANIDIQKPIKTYVEVSKDASQFAHLENDNLELNFETYLNNLSI